MPTPIAPQPPVVEKDIDQLVRDLLENSRGSWPEVALKTGVSYSWLSKFANGHIDNPGIDTLRKIRDHFKAGA